MQNSQITPFSEAIDSFLAYIQLEKGLSDNTVHSYSSDLTQFAQFLSTQNLHTWPEIGQIALSQWLISLSQKNYEITTILRKLSAVRTLAKFLLSEGILSTDFTELVTGPEKTKKLPNVLSIPQIDTLVNVIKLDNPLGLRDRAMIELIYSSGLRVSELCSMELQNIDMQSGFLRVNGKGNKTRVVPFGNTALYHLKKYLNDGRPNLMKDNTGGAIFITARGDKISRKTLWVILKKYASLANLPQTLKPHTLRHSFATHLLANGADLRVIQEMLGHADISTTEIYTSIDKSKITLEHNKYHPRNRINQN